MDLDASRKAQLIIFMRKLLHMPEAKFPPGYVATMVYKDRGYGTYVYMPYGWKRVG